MNQTGLTSGLKATLLYSSADAKADLIARVAAVYAETQNMAETAQRFGISVRTLERCVYLDQDLAAAIQKIRDGLNVVPEGQRAGD